MKRPKYVFIILIGVLVMAEVLVLRPARLETNEESSQRGMFKDLTSMLKARKKDDEIKYTIQKFHYTAVEGEIKQWEMDADTAIMYDSSQHVFATNAHIKMFDPTGKITFIEGKEAKYMMGSRNFDLFKDVKVTFPDGFWLKTEQAKYASSTGIVSTSEPFYGESAPANQVGQPQSEDLKVWGTGFEAPRSGPIVHILADAHVRILRRSNNEISDIRSDKARIDRFQKISYFSMNKASDYVNADLGTLHVRSKLQEANYSSGGDGANTGNGLKYMTALNDVLIKETDKVKGQQGLKYATCQQADFISKENKILMVGFPQAYQENDTVTGEVITVYRSQNLVEVKQANGYHDGSSEPVQQQPRQ